MDFAKLKSQSNKALETLTSEVSKLDNNSKKSDDRFWSPTVDKAGNGMAVIRFLPAHPDEDVPFIRTFDHGFKGPGGWYIENSLTTLGQKDPVSEYNSKLWNSTDSDSSPERKQARDQKRRLHYISNIYVVQDQANPENEGKVFLYKYGKKIFDKLKEAMEPQFEDETAINPFDLWTGANFKLKIRNVEGYRNYDKSEFDKPAPLLKDDEKLEKIWKQEYPLKAFLDPSNFKSYDELQARLLKVLGNDNINRTKTAATIDEDEAPSFKASHAPNYSSEDEDDDEMAFFEALKK